MMSVGARRLETSQLEGEGLGQYEQLIELQKQIVSVAEQNAATEQRCARLREQLEREFDAIIGPRKPVHERLREVATGMFGRWLKRPDAPLPAKRS